jgi:hypothetical protein
MGPRSFVGIWLDVQTQVLWVFKNEPQRDHIAHCQYCRDLSRQPGVFLVARFLVRSVAHIPIAHGRPYHTPWHTGKGRPEQHLTFARVPVWLDANLDIATKKTLLSTVEAIHASSETLGTIEQQYRPISLSFHLSCHSVSSLVFARVWMSDVFTVVSPA